MTWRPGMLKQFVAAVSLGVVAALGVAAPVEAATDPPLEATVTPKRASFGKVVVGTTVVQEITVTNTGTDPLSIESGSIFFLQVGGTGGFTSTDFDLGTCGDFPIVLAPDESCTWSIALTAGNTGRAFGDLCVVARSPDASASSTECTRWSAVIRQR